MFPACGCHGYHAGPPIGPLPMFPGGYSGPQAPRPPEAALTGPKNEDRKPEASKNEGKRKKTKRSEEAGRHEERDSAVRSGSGGQGGGAPGSGPPSGPSGFSSGSTPSDTEEDPDASSADTSAIRSMLKKRVKQQLERPKSSLGSVRIEEFGGERYRYVKWKKAVEAQQQLYRLDEAFGESEEELFERTEKEYAQYRRLPGQPVAAYNIGQMKRLKAQYQRVDPETQISDRAWAQRLLNRCSLSRRERLDVFFSAGGQYDPPAIERALRHRCANTHEDERKIPSPNRTNRPYRPRAMEDKKKMIVKKTYKKTYLADQEEQEQEEEEDLEAEEITKDCLFEGDAEGDEEGLEVIEEEMELEGTDEEDEEPSSELFGSLCRRMEGKEQDE